ncbi:hypothetical protein JX266_005112 [Neoarthrinium moseri]|nr:hypothetical protein JX266_005112 [Neoarthrinium moseri]
MASLLGLLDRAAAASPSAHVFFHGEDGHIAMTYVELHRQATENALIIRHELGVSPGQVVLLHLDSQANYMTWFWSVLAANAIPVMSTPLPADEFASGRHLKHLNALLGNPTVLTVRSLRAELVSISDTQIRLLDELATAVGKGTQPHPVGNVHSETAARCGNNTAFMMLTSGSTGGAKAVDITHSQVLASLQAKSQMTGTSERDTFLNWIGFDHVACVTEIHLHALAACATQVHIEPKMVIRDPLLWLDKLASHKVSYTFAPNFFLAAVLKAVRGKASDDTFNLSELRLVVSGGEANAVATGIAFNEMTKSFGAPRDVLCPAFGMTETCAGSIYNFQFPALEREAKLEFASVGQSTSALSIRIVDTEGTILSSTETGQLELSGLAVAQAYYNNPRNATQLFTHDGWFKTGDTGYLDSQGNLILSGRTKDSIIINGVKYFSHELEAAVDAAVGEEDIVPSFTSAFATWPKGGNSEEVIITILTVQANPEDTALAAIIDKIAKATFLYCSKKPSAVIPLPSKLLGKSSLGKLSRTALKQAYEHGKFDDYINDTATCLRRYRKKTRKSPETDMESELARIFATEFELDPQEVGVDDSLVNFGVDSIRLLRFKGVLQDQLGISDIPIGVLLTNPSISSMAKALSSSGEVGVYDPVVVLQSAPSRRTPIWFIHPGLGEVLVFLNISRFFSDRQVYALRAPGFNPGEKMFTSIDEMTDVYMHAIKRRQPHGPYVLVGYSFGSMIAFETTKKLEAAGNVVFMGSLNGPPHIKWRMVQIDWCELFLNLSYFLGFITEEEAVQKGVDFHKAGYTRDEILDRILALAPPEKMRELDLTREKIARWADISSQLQGLAHRYDPCGTVDHIDVFFANPLLAVGKDKQQWLRQHLHPWNDFAKEPVRFHDSPGAHYTMLSPEHVFQMQKVLRTAFAARGAL